MSKAVSFSRMAGYKKCPASYEWQYVLGHKKEFSPGPAAIRGTRIHNSIEDKYLNRGELDEEIPLKMHDHLLRYHNRENWIAYPEFEFALTKEWKHTGFEDDDAYVRGYIDGLFTRLDADHNVVEVQVDEYKTGQVYDEHVQQKAMYGMVMLCLYPDIPQVTVTGVYLDKKKLEPTTYMRAHLFTMQHVWKKDIAKLDIPIFPARPGRHCMWCPKSKKKEGGTCQLG